MFKWTGEKTQDTSIDIHHDLHFFFCLITLGSTGLTKGFFYCSRVRILEEFTNEIRYENLKSKQILFSREKNEEYHIISMQYEMPEWLQIR